MTKRKWSCLVESNTARKPKSLRGGPSVAVTDASMETTEPQRLEARVYELGCRVFSASVVDRHEDLLTSKRISKVMVNGVQ